MPSRFCFRYATPALAGPWRFTLAGALQSALEAGQADLDVGREIVPHRYVTFEEQAAELCDEECSCLKTAPANHAFSAALPSQQT